MPYEQLIESVDECAREIIEKIAEKTDREAMEILAEARGKGEIIRKKHNEATRRSVEAERSKSLSWIKKEARMQLIYAKDEVYQKAFSEASAQLSSIRNQATYEPLFSKLLQEVLTELEGESILLHIDRRDEDLCKKLLSELNSVCEIRTDISTAGGLNADTMDEKFVVFNTLESRLERAGELLKPEIFAALYGDDGGM